MRLSTPPGPADLLPQQEVEALLELVAVEQDARATVQVPVPSRAPEALAHDLDGEAEHLVLELDREASSGSRWGGDAGGRSEAELVALARAGDDAALAELLGRYRSFAAVKARSYFLIGADRDDVVQEGLIGLYKAVRDFDPSHDTSFRGFAELCVTRQILTAIKTATRQKHGPLNDYVSFSRTAASEDDGERVFAEVLPARAVCDPADLVISAERVRALQAHVDEVLSDLETEVLRLHVEGKSYQQIAERLQRQVKSIDNALQRIKKKLESHLRAGDDED